MQKIQNLPGDDAALAVEKHDVKLTARGSIALGVRKSLSLTSALGFPIASLVDTSRQTVTRCEIMVWALMCCRPRAFHQLVQTRLEAIAGVFKGICLQDGTTQSHKDCLAMTLHDIFGSALEKHLSDIPTESEAIEKDLSFAPVYSLQWMITTTKRKQQQHQEFDVGDLFCIAGVFFSGDATNSNMWRQHKLQGLMVSSSLLTNINALEHETEWRDAFSRHTTMSLGTTMFVCMCIVH